MNIPTFKSFISEAVVDGLMTKINACRTVEGLDELEKYYQQRSKEVQVSASDDITVRDAIAGRRADLTPEQEEEQEEEV